MPQPAISLYNSRRMTSRQRAAARRRRLLLSAVAVAVVVAGVFAAMPLFRQAYNSLSLPLAYPDLIRQQAAEKHLDPALIAAVIYAETKFDPRTSPTGAEGLMQIEPRTAQFLAHRSGATTFSVSDLGTPEVNIAYGSYYLRYLLDEYSGSETLALAAYNGGEANVNRWIVSERAAGRPLTIAEIPFAETRAYVVKVMQAQHDYRRQYASQLGY
jgi:soluble lytic murein transglycosylase